MQRKMKDSGIEWIGEIPENWMILPNKRIMGKIKNICDKYQGEDILSLTIKGVIKRDLKNPKGKMPTTFDGYQRVNKGNLLLCLFDIDVTPRCVGLIKDDGLTSPAYSQFEMKGNNSAKYYDYLLRMIDNDKCYLHLSKNLRSSLTESDFGMISTIVPPLEEQEKIANYLDNKCEEIDTIIENINIVIQEYKNYKQSIITETVIKGLNRYSEMKNSGIPWIGEVPKSWEVMKIKHIMFNKSIKNHPNEEVLSLYRDFGIIPKNSRNDNHNVTSENTETYKLVDVNDFVVNKMKAWQGSMAVSSYRGIVSPAYHVCEIYNKKIYNKYLHYLLRNQLYIPEFRRLSTGMRVGQWDLSIDDFMNIKVVVPELKEQINIVNYLDKKCEDINNIIEKKYKLIEELNRYKKSLIYECVTGKKEI